MFGRASSLLIAATLAVSTLTSVINAQPYCFDGDNGLICLTGWGVGNGNLTVHMQCKPVPGQGDGALSWCGFGVNTGKNLTAWGMYPSSAWILQVLNDNKTVVVEDRSLIAAARPACYSQQLSYTLYSSVDSNGVVRASFTRPVIPSAFYQALGYPNITDTVFPLVAAYASGETRTSTACGMDFSFHDQVFNNATINFLGQ